MVINIALLSQLYMDIISNQMDNLSMNYYDGLDFVCGGCLANHGAHYIRQFKDYYGIQYSQDGEFAVEIKPAYKRVVTGAWALITRPGPVFRYGTPPGRRRLHAFVCFKGPRVNQYIQSGLLPLNPRDPLIKINRPEHFLETLRRLVVLINPLAAGRYGRAVHNLEDLLLQLHEQPAATAAFPEYWRAHFAELAARIDENPEQAWDFPALAGELHLSYPHFRRLFRQQSSLAPGQFLIQARLRQAVTRLVGTDQQVKVLAAECGFTDSFYFSRLFKKYFRLSPLRYRRELRRDSAGGKTA